ncbi:MAG: hypothetical protein ACJ763_01890 [Bdellovibrionia bacterium]
MASSAAEKSSVAEKPGDIYCYGEYTASVRGYTFKATCTQGKVYEKKTTTMMPSPEELFGLQHEVVAKMKGDGYQLLESFRGGQIVVLKKASASDKASDKEVCLISAERTGVFSKDKYYYSVVLPGAVVDCSADSNVDLQEVSEMTANEQIEKNGFKKVAQIGNVSVYEK